MMSNYKKTPSGFFKSESTVISGSDILWSSGQTWEGLTIEQHIFAGKKAPEFKTSDDSLIIQLSPAGAEKNKPPTISPVNHSANICFFPIGLLRQRSCAHHQEKVLLLILSTEVVRRAARE